MTLARLTQRVSHSRQISASASRSGKYWLFRPSTKRGLPVWHSGDWTPVRCCKCLPVRKTLAFPSVYQTRLTRLTQWVLNSRQTLQVPPGQENIGFSVRLPNEAYPSDTVGIELPSGTANASQSGKLWLFRPSTNEAYPADTVSTELPLDATKLLRPAFKINSTVHRPVRSTHPTPRAAPVKATWTFPVSQFKPVHYAIEQQCEPSRSGFPNHVAPRPSASGAHLPSAVSCSRWRQYGHPVRQPKHAAPPSSTSRAHPSDAVSCSRRRSCVSLPDRAPQSRCSSSIGR